MRPCGPAPCRRMGVQIFAAQKHGPTGTITAMKACGARRNEVVMGLYNKYGSWWVSHTHLRHHGVPQRGAASRMRDGPKGALRAVFLAVSDPTLNSHQRPPWRRTMVFLGLLMAYANRARRWTHRRRPWMAYAAVRAGVRWRVANAEIGRPQHGPTSTITAMKACCARHDEVVMGLYTKYGL